LLVPRLTISADRRAPERLALDVPAHPVIHRHARPARLTPIN